LKNHDRLLRLRKTLPHEESSGIPLIIQAPGGVKNLVSTTLVSSVDYYPTCLDFTGITPGVTLPGRSLAPILYKLQLNLLAHILQIFSWLIEHE
jgi:arylsulfatase A-like enzyme